MAESKHIRKKKEGFEWREPSTGDNNPLYTYSEIIPRQTLELKAGKNGKFKIFSSRLQIDIGGGNIQEITVFDNVVTQGDIEQIKKEKSTSLDEKLSKTNKSKTQQANRPHIDNMR